jgi:S1/P1 nuclease
MRLATFIGGLILVLLPTKLVAWSPPGHTVTGAIAYENLLQDPEQRATLGAIRPLLYAKPLDPDGSMQRQTQNLSRPAAEELRFILATTWADLIRKADPGKHRDKWHYINWPFKPESERSDIFPAPPQSENILGAFARHEHALRSASLERRAVAFAWLLHLVGDAHQPLHTIQLFTREYPQGDRGGNEICVRTAPGAVPLSLHMLWDGLIASSNGPRAVINIAGELRKKFPASRSKELGSVDPKIWAQESYQAAKTVAYMNGSLRGTPKGERRDCSEIANAKILPAGYVAKSKDVAERRIALAGYRLASLLARVCRQGFCGKAPVGPS